MTDDPRIVYGARCVWWDAIDEAGTVYDKEIETPCCPHCGEDLYEMASIEDWWQSVERYERTHPGYRKFVEWQRGKCFPNISEAQAAYEDATQRTHRIMTDKLGDAPIQSEYREKMNAIAGALDELFNGDARGSDRQTGFVLLVFPFGSRDGRCNYISNGANRKDIVVMFKEQIKRFEGQPEMTGTA